MKFEIIKERIKNGNKYVLYNLEPEKPYLLAQGKTKTEINQIVKEKIKKNPQKYRDIFCILMYYEFRVPDNKVIFGELLINLQRYFIRDNLKIEIGNKPLGYVYFHADWLEENGFSYTYLRNIIYLYKLDKISFNPLGQPGYSGLKGYIRQALKYYEKLKK